VALNYFADGSVDSACPPIRALLHIMAYSDYEGRDIQHPEIRAMFTRESLLASDWYQERLQHKQRRDIALWERHLTATQSDVARARLEKVRSVEYLRELVGTIGADPAIGFCKRL
jgi:hypothetical protein